MAPRAFRLLVAAATVIGALMLASPADAQVFKPRNKTAAVGKAAPNAAAARKASPPAATASKKTARTEPARKAKTKKRHSKARGDDDVKIQDDDDDVKITDD
jgi:predicted flap endonuclease-1-like 5' DNA nuclease